MTDGLRPRPEVPPEVLEAIYQAAERAIAEDGAGAPKAPAWRFSGRWFTAHPIRSRSRPG